MDLKGQLDRFKKQQERCQSTLSSINASRAPPSAPSRPSSSSSSSSVPAATSLKPAPPVKFSNDTERLQFINSIRKGPVGAQIKRVIELLFETRQAFTPEQINERCYVDMLSNKAVFDSLRNNPKVYYDGRRFSYKAKHDVKDKKPASLAYQEVSCWDCSC
ncbi:hypothetical protein Rs2_04730 [Raphanus sativus]|nr:hypothetical protein Rs2_04730 [Raphanus sativus]